jgi:hypothetical protein
MYPDGYVRFVRTDYYSGDDAHVEFIVFLRFLQSEVVPALWDQYRQPMLPLSAAEEAAHDHALLCMYCNRPLQDDTVHDHSHLTGQCRGAAHSDCNLQAGRKEAGESWRKTPVVFHNLKVDDAHLIMRGIGEQVVAQEYRLGNLQGEAAAAAAAAVKQQHPWQLE